MVSMLVLIGVAMVLVDSKWECEREINNGECSWFRFLLQLSDRWKCIWYYFGWDEMERGYVALAYDGAIISSHLPAYVIQLFPLFFCFLFLLFSVSLFCVLYAWSRAYVACMHAFTLLCNQLYTWTSIWILFPLQACIYISTSYFVLEYETELMKFSFPHACYAI